jgi:hypothetical protein
MDRWGQDVARTYCAACDNDLPELEGDALADAHERAYDRARERAYDRY